MTILVSHGLTTVVTLRTIYIGMKIVEIDKGKDMWHSREIQNLLFHFYYLSINIWLTIID